MDCVASRSVEAAALWMLFKGKRIEHTLHSPGSPLAVMTCCWME